MQCAIVIGASSGIGRELAKVLSNNGYAVGLAARRLDLLTALQSELTGKSCARQMDVARTDEAVQSLHGVIEELGGMDLIVICSGVDYYNSNLAWKETKDTIEVNICGFAALADAAFGYFAKQGSGHIVGISSIAALRGSGAHPAYSASKAFVSNYLEGLRMKAMKSGLNIHITDIRPGNVDTPMSKGQPGLFWVAPPEKAARQIFSAIHRRKRIAYITKRWRLIARLLRVMPTWLYAKF